MQGCPRCHEAKGRDAAALRGFRSWQGSPGWVAGGSQEREAALMAGECGCMRAGRAGPCPCSGEPVAACRFQWELRQQQPAWRFPEKQPRLSTCLASLPLTWLLHQTGRSSLWIHLWEILLRLLRGVVWVIWGPCSSDQPAHVILLQGLVFATVARAGGRGSGIDLSRLPLALWLLAGAPGAVQLTLGLVTLGRPFITCLVPVQTLYSPTLCPCGDGEG